MFTQKELDLLMEGLSAIEKADQMGSAMIDMLSTMTARTDEEREKMMAEREARKHREALRLRERCLAVTVLKGKLAQMAISQERDAPFELIDRVI